ncbi:hypothetical protein MNBD_ACTINO02-856, partial [hydrothermal vent metagenome]
MSTSAPVSVAVEARAASKIFSRGKPNQVVALESINLSVRQGGFVALIGPSGCGKSTLLRLMAGLVPATEGEIFVN